MTEQEDTPEPIKKEPSISENEKFIWLMRVACEDREVEENLLNILSLGSTERQQTIETLTHFLIQQGESSQMIQAIEYLKHDLVAEQAKLFIEENAYHRKRERKKAEKAAKKNQEPIS